jgi:hypothetical protein
MDCVVTILNALTSFSRYLDRFPAQHPHQNALRYHFAALFERLSAAAN